MAWKLSEGDMIELSHKGQGEGGPEESQGQG